uniref:BfmA/BtgA family mobilization protein n=1 Tax=Roseihalotalea indica TaxID=2867963 RepID=A0AA49JC63_9BACT|nr:BfmA/BtgA family mobilization protein [Tunicatimonas sp. TK19036]
MYHSKKVNISDERHRCLTQEAGRFKLSHKEYVEAAIQFFSERQLNPATYQPETTKKILEQAIDRLFSYLVHQEKQLLKPLLQEAAKARILGEVSANHLLTLRAEDDPSTFERLQQQDQQYLAQRLRGLADQVDTNLAPHSPITDSSNS